MRQIKPMAYGLGPARWRSLTVGKSSFIPASFTPVLLISSVLSAPIAIAPIATAQIIPDTTLNQNSRVEAGCTTCFIAGGTTVGTTLFHSFEEFSVPTGSRAFFVNATSISDIISRVTGDSISTIDGRLDTSGEANLFLLNPNGVIFGPNATLSIGGSFLATTADRFEFANAQLFSAINPEPAPASLTISTPIGLQFGADPGAIAIQGSTLRGAEDNTLAFIGGALEINNASIEAVPGRIELGGVGTNSTVLIEPHQANNQLQLNYAPTDTFQTIDLETSEIRVGEVQNGSIQIQGQTIKIRRDAMVESIASDGTAGDIFIRATESLELVGQSFDKPTGIFNIVEDQASAENGGVTRLESPQILVQRGAEVSTNTIGSGQGARLEVIANDIRLDGGLLDEENNSTPSGFFARTNERFDPQQSDDPATGNGGDIFIQSDRLTLIDGAQISTSTFGQGNAGNIEIRANERINISGQLLTNEDATDLLVSGIFAQVEVNNVANAGDGGTIRLNTPILEVTGGAQIATAARSTGRGGNIFINDSINNAQLVLLSGTADVNRPDNISGILVSAEEGARNDAGSLTLHAERLIVEDGARISADNRGSAQGGSATITVQDLIVRNGGEILAASFADDPSQPGFDELTPTSGGDAGSLTITAQSVQLLNDGEISVSAQENARAGRILLTADTLVIAGDSQIRAETVANRNADGSAINENIGDNGDASIELVIDNSILITGGRISALTEEGQGGDVLINADIAQTPLPLLQLSGKSFISAEARGGGDGGTVTIRATDLDIQDRARISTRSQSGTSGTIGLDIGNALKLRNRGRILALTQDGIAGQIQINSTSSAPAPMVRMGDRSRISAAARGTGDAGKITILATNINLQDSSSILASTQSGTSGNIALAGIETLQILDNSTISAATDTGTAGSIMINTIGSEVIVSGENAEISVRADGNNGVAGNLTIDTTDLAVTNGGDLSVSSPNGTAGNLIISATNIVLDDGTLSAETQQTPPGEMGANIDITGINILFLTSDSLISARALEQADGGNVTLDASQGFITTPVEVNSDIIANANQGDGGDINITTQGLFGLQERRQNPITNDIDASSAFGLDGTVAITRIEVDPSRGLVALPSGVVDVSRLIAQQCNAGGYAERQRSDFVITGRGGLVPAPGELLGQSLWDDMRSPFTPTQSAASSVASLPPSSSSLSDAIRSPLIEAQAWTQTPDGQILLLAQTSTPHQTQNTQWQTAPTCTQ